MTESTDLNNASGGFTILHWKLQTANTPRTEGLTTASSGIVLSYIESADWAVQFGMIPADKKWYVRVKSSGEWSRWEEKSSKRPYVYSKATVDNTNPVTIELENYSTYLLFMQHDGGNNSMISAIMSEATQKITKITSSGDVFNATLENQKLTITSTTTYWTYTIIKLS